MKLRIRGVIAIVVACFTSCVYHKVLRSATSPVVQCRIIRASFGERVKPLTLSRLSRRWGSSVSRIPKSVSGDDDK